MFIHKSYFTFLTESTYCGLKPHLTNLKSNGLNFHSPVVMSAKHNHLIAQLQHREIFSEQLCIKISFVTACVVCRVVPFRTCPVEKLKCVPRAWKCWTPAANCLLRLKTLSRQVVYLQASSFHASFLKVFRYAVFFLRSRGVSVLSFPIRLSRAFAAMHSFLSLRCYLRTNLFSLNSEFHGVFLRQLLKTDGLKPYS